MLIFVGMLVAEESLKVLKCRISKCVYVFSVFRLMQVVKDFCFLVVGEIGFDDFLVEWGKEMHRRLDNDAY